MSANAKKSRTVCQQCQLALDKEKSSNKPKADTTPKPIIEAFLYRNFDSIKRSVLH